MKKNKIALKILTFSLITFSFIACEEDYATLESDVIDRDVATNFEIYSEPSDIVAYTKALAPVQTNQLSLSTLGIYDDVYGRTTASFLTQVNASSYSPDFGEDVVIDSVALTIPYFSKPKGFDEDGNLQYSVDSILPKGDIYKPINLRLFESNYFIRDFNPDGDFNESQAYFSNKSASANEPISVAALESEELNFVEYNDNGEMTIADNIININELDGNGNPVETFSQLPALRVFLEPNYWKNKIIDKEGDLVLSGQNNFADYFRGLYFKAEPINNDGSFLFLNLNNQNANITIYYSRLTPSTADDPDEREQATYTINFGPNKINFMENDFTTPINNGDEDSGDSRIYLKGGEGSIAGIKLFDGFYDEDAGITNFEKFRSDFVNLEDNKFVSSRRLVNEANLVFYLDETIGQTGEPDRLYLYNLDNKTPLVDYYLDVANNSLPAVSLTNHLGPLQRVDDEPTGAGVKYKFRITEHINNLLVRDSTNVELGLAVSLNVNLEEIMRQRAVQDPNEEDVKAPASSVLSPRGVVLHGNNTENENKRVYLEIYYTEPNN